MSSLLDELSRQARSLAIEERAQLAQRLMESVERESDPDVQEAWDSEVASRIAKYERGQARSCRRSLCRCPPPDPVKPVRFLEEAQEEFLEQVAYYEERENPDGVRAVAATLPAGKARCAISSP